MFSQSSDIRRDVLGTIDRVQYGVVRVVHQYCGRKILQTSGIHFSCVGYLLFVLRRAFAKIRFSLLEIHNLLNHEVNIIIIQCFFLTHVS